MKATPSVWRRSAGKSTTLAALGMPRPGEPVMSWHKAVEATCPEVRVGVPKSKPTGSYRKDEWPSDDERWAEARRDLQLRFAELRDRNAELARSFRRQATREILGVIAALAVAALFLIVLFLCGR